MFWLGLHANAQDLSALARVMPGSEIRDRAGGVDLHLNLTQPVPYRVFHLTDPWRVVVDFREVDWGPVDLAGLDRSAAILDLRAGVFRPGWSRLVMELDAPLALDSVQMSTGERAVLSMRLMRVDDEAFAASAGLPDDARFAAGLPVIGPPEAVAAGPNGPLVVVLDPGHGGIDPGAEKGNVVEAELMLQFARELKELLLRTGGFEVILTRQEDIFVSLESRVSIAHAAGADLFMSLHADILAEGRASGATIYTLSDDASDIASRKLAERHDRADLLAGVDLSEQDDEVALVLMDLARTETAHRADALAEALVAGLDDKVALYKNPHLQAGFSVLKAADIPSVLVELGFMSQPNDLANLLDTDWRRRAAEGLRDGLVAWAQSDLAEKGLRRR